MSENTKRYHLIVEIEVPEVGYQEQDIRDAIKQLKYVVSTEFVAGSTLKEAAQKWADLVCKRLTVDVFGDNGVE